MGKSIEGDIENSKEMLSLLALVLGDEEPEPTKQK
jgi:hypothetical protein